MNMQAELNFEIAEPSVKTLNDMVRVLLSNGNWWTPWELCDELRRTKNLMVSDSTVSARLRDLRKKQYGGYTVSIRKRQGSRSFEYHLEK